MLTLLLVLGFPLVLATGYAGVFTAARMARGRAGIEAAQSWAPNLFPLFLLVPAIAVVATDPQLLRRFAPPASHAFAISVGAIALGAALFFGESRLNGWRQRRRNEPSALDGIILVPALLPLLSLTVVLAEELVWRGYLLTRFTSQYDLPRVVALVIAAAFFAIHHGHFGVLTASYKGFCAVIWGLLFLANGQPSSIRSGSSDRRLLCLEATVAAL